MSATSTRTATAGAKPASPRPAANQMTEAEWIDQLESLAMALQDLAIFHGCGKGCLACRQVQGLAITLEDLAEDLKTDPAAVRPDVLSPMQRD